MLLPCAIDHLVRERMHHPFVHRPPIGRLGQDARLRRTQRIQRTGLSDEQLPLPRSDERRSRPRPAERPRCCRGPRTRSWRTRVLNLLKKIQDGQPISYATPLVASPSGNLPQPPSALHTFSTISSGSSIRSSFSSSGTSFYGHWQVAHNLSLFSLHSTTSSLSLATSAHHIHACLDVA